MTRSHPHDDDDAVTAERLFREAFLPLYPADAATDLARARREDANPANNPTIVAHLGEAADVFAKMAPQVLGPPGANLDLDFSDASVHRLSAALTRDVRERWRAEPAYGTSESTLFNVVVHGSAYVGECIVRAHRGVWLVRRPLWESLVALRSAAGDAQIAVFHLWLKALSDEALAGKAASLADRYRTHVEVPTFDADALPVFLKTERRTPRLSKVRYDAFYKYLRAHFPEIRDVGADFPSPERFDELRLRWIEGHVVGGGRMALFAGAGEAGVHLYWLDASGFVKAAFVPADKFPEPIVRIDGPRVRVLVQQDGQPAERDMLWWGP